MNPSRVGKRKYARGRAYNPDRFLHPALDIESDDEVIPELEDEAEVLPVVTDLPDVSELDDVAFDFEGEENTDDEYDDDYDDYEEDEDDYDDYDDEDDD